VRANIFREHHRLERETHALAHAGIPARAGTNARRTTDTYDAVYVALGGGKRVNHEDQTYLTCPTT
jgi:hypothetical protein